MIVKLKDVVNRVNNNIDRFTTDIQYYLGKGHGECGELAISEHGDLKKDVGTLGFKFHFGFKPGDTLFFSRSFALRKAGMATYEGICSDSTYILRSKDEAKLLSKYLPIVLQSDVFWEYCDTHHTGGVNFLINWSTLADYEFDLPCLEEQQRISDRIWSAYNLKESYKKLLIATDELVKSQFIEMLNTEGYEYLALGEVCSKITDGSHNPPKGCDSSDYIMISSKNISPDYLDLSDVRYLTKDEFESENKRTNVSANDILLTIVGTIGRTYLVKGNEGNIVMQRSVAVLTPKKNINPTFLMYSLLIDSELEKEGRGNAQKGVYLKQLAKYKVKIPSFKCQNKFCEIYNQADKSKLIRYS